jgi:hypothetical protein
MGKNKKESVESESYGSSVDFDEEGEEMMEDGESDMGSCDSAPAIREVNKAHVLNYKSDDSDESENGAADSDSSADAPKDTRMNDTWGNKKQSYYAKDSGSEGLDSSEAEEDQL